jgi:hypothetical protein
MVQKNCDFSTSPFKAKMLTRKLRVQTMLIIGGMDMKRQLFSASPPWRPTGREARGRDRRGYSDEGLRAADLNIKVTYYLDVVSSRCS